MRKSKVSSKSEELITISVLPMLVFHADWQRLYLRPELAWTRVALGGSAQVQRICLLVTNPVSLRV